MLEVKVLKGLGNEAIEPGSRVAERGELDYVHAFWWRRGRRGWIRGVCYLWRIRREMLLKCKRAILQIRVDVLSALRNDT